VRWNPLRRHGAARSDPGRRGREAARGRRGPLCRAPGNPAGAGPRSWYCLAHSWSWFPALPPSGGRP